MTIKAYRTGTMSGPDPGEEIGTAGVYVNNCGLDCDYFRLSLAFSDERGFGRSTYSLHIDPDGFEALAVAMMRTNRDAAIKAIGVALQADPVPIKRQERWSPLWAA